MMKRLAPGRAWKALIFVGISLVAIGALTLVVYGTPNFPAIAIGGIGMLLTCYSFFSWRESRRTGMHT